MLRCFVNAEEREIEKIYRVGKFSTYEIAKQYHCSAPTIRKAVGRVGGKMRSPGETKHLQSERGIPNSNRRFMEAEDREIEKIYRVGLLSAGAIAIQYCCAPCTINGAIRRAGGRMRTSQESSTLHRPLVYRLFSGYPAIMVSRLKGSAFSIAEQTAKAAGCIMVHRLVMALHLRRPLLSAEIVHHKDGNKANYHISNLELLTQESHTSAWGNPYYQKWQEALSEIRELKAKMGRYAQMTNLDEMTNAEIWEEIEDCFQTISMDVEHRSYGEHSMIGARHIQHLVRRNLDWIDRALLEIDVRAAKAGKEDNDGQCNNLLQYSESVRRL